MNEEINYIRGEGNAHEVTQKVKVMIPWNRKKKKLTRKKMKIKKRRSRAHEDRNYLRKNKIAKRKKNMMR